MMNMLKVSFLFSTILIFSSHSHSAPYNADPVGETVVAQTEELLNSALKFAATKGKSNRMIKTARKNFFDLYPNRPDFAKADIQFSELLREKDLYYLSLFLTKGATIKEKKSIEAIEKMTGGLVDDGIRSSSWSSFADWVNAVREPLGGKRPGDIVFVFDSKKLWSAIDTSEGPYKTYMKKRDEAEFRARNIDSHGHDIGSSRQ
ncbi:MAG: hypothetical protein V7739_21115 [Motiliproteus sp.]